MKWENLDVTPMSRKLRRAFTSLVCVVLLILSFIIIYLAQTEQVTTRRTLLSLFVMSLMSMPATGTDMALKWKTALARHF